MQTLVFLIRARLQKPLSSFAGSSIPEVDKGVARCGDRIALGHFRDKSTLVTPLASSTSGRRNFFLKKNRRGRQFVRAIGLNLRQNLVFNYAVLQNFDAANKTVDRAVELNPHGIGPWEIKIRLAIAEKGDFSAYDRLIGARAIRMI